MKKINLRNIGPGDKQSHYTKRRMHSVYLGNSVNVFFRDKKKAQAFIVATNKFLNQKLYEINALYFELFAEYRRAWFYFFSIKGQGLQTIAVLGVFRSFEVVESRINHMVGRSEFGNGSAIVFHGFRVSIDSLLTVSESLEEMYKDKKHYSESYQVRIISQRLKRVQADLNDWGKNFEQVDIYNDDIRDEAIS